MAHWAKIFGSISYNIDGTKGGSHTLQTALLKADIPIIKHLTNLTHHETNFSAALITIERVGTFPTRAYAALIQH